MLQLLDLSGILTVFFCGIVMSHYTWHNVTEGSRITTKYVTNVLNASILSLLINSVSKHSTNQIEFTNYSSFLFAVLSFNSRHAFATLSFIAETFLFLYVGMDALDIEKWKFVSSRYGLEKNKCCIACVLI